MGSLQEYHDKMGPPKDGKPECFCSVDNPHDEVYPSDGNSHWVRAAAVSKINPELLIPNCGISTKIYHNEIGFLVWCVERQSHNGPHHADITWDRDAS